MPQKFIDETGNQYGLLTVKWKVKVEGSGGALWHCECACGKIRQARGIQLRKGDLKSCGKCLNTRTHMIKRYRYKNPLDRIDDDIL